MAQAGSQVVKRADNQGVSSQLSQIVKNEQAEILKEWLATQSASLSTRKDLLSDDALAKQSKQFLSLFADAIQSNDANLETSSWQGVKDFLAEISISRAQQGFSPIETAAFVFSIKQPIYNRLLEELGKDTASLVEASWAFTSMIDSLGLYTTEIYQKSREDIIRRQQQDMLELSTPVVRLWDGILALPLIGTLDSARTQVVMETLLQEIVSTGAAIAIIDITGVPTVDTLVAQHLLKTVAAARLMGADCIISGIRPQIAQTIVHLGVELNDVITKATLADAFAIAMKRLNLTVIRAAA